LAENEVVALKSDLVETGPTVLVATALVCVGVCTRIEGERRTTVFFSGYFNSV